MTREECCRLAGEELVFAEGYDEAIIGVTFLRPGEAVVTYDVTTIIGILMTRDGMSAEDAVEFFDFNIVDAYIGVQAPLFVPKTFMETRAKLRSVPRAQA